ncbi:MAG: NUDIX domain-containing protein [Micrococcales bacterium]|nr:NUDIX domain-containing protein [Micrococcales bacterium]
MSDSPQRRLVRKAVGYVVNDGRLLVFTHDDLPLEITGVQVPAGTIEPGEQPEVAVVREVFEETGIAVRIARALGVDNYDVWPSKAEVHERHFFQLSPRDVRLADRWNGVKNWRPTVVRRSAGRAGGCRWSRLTFSVPGSGRGSATLHSRTSDPPSPFRREVVTIGSDSSSHARRESIFRFRKPRSRSQTRC